MKSCDIHIRSIDPGELGDVGLACSVKLEEADIADKLMLMHAMAVNLHLDAMDILLFAKTEIDHAFDEGATVITMPGGLNRES